MKKADEKNLYDELIKNLIQLTNLEFSHSGMEIDDIENSILNELESAAKFQKKLDNSNIRKFNNSFHFEKKFFNLIILLHESLWLIFAKHFYHQEVKVEISEYDRNKMVTYLFILSNLINNLLATLKLLERGLSQSSDILFRNYMELSEIGVAILNDNNYYETYKKECESEKEQFSKWNKTKPSKTFKVVKNALSKIEIDEFYDIFYEVRSTLYGFTSKTVHGNIESIVKGALLFEDESVKLSIYGNINSDLKNNFTNYFIYSKTMVQAITVILVKDYKLHFDKFGEEGRYHVFLQSLTDKIFKIYLKIKN